jgi:hypothetical protein
MELLGLLASLTGQTIKTLDQCRAFDVLDVSRAGVIIHIQRVGNERLIPYKQIEGAYCDLIVHGELSRSQIEAQYSPRNPAYVAALLAQLPGVQHSIRPIVLRCK